jgi:hypothetical protein
MVQPTALNFVVIGLMVLIFNFLWRIAAGAIINRNSESELGAAMGALA